MGLIKFKDLPNTDTPINAENLNHNFNEVIGTVLYEDAKGTMGIINLSENLKNYKYIEIYGYDNANDSRIYSKIESPGTGTRYFNFGGIINAAGVNTMVFKVKKYDISGNKISINAYGPFMGIEINVNSMSFTKLNEDTLYINKVVGYK